MTNYLEKEQEDNGLTSERKATRSSFKRCIPHRWLRFLASCLLLSVVVGSFLPPARKTQIGTQQRRAGRSEGIISRQHRLYHFASFGLTAMAFLLLAEDFRKELRSAVGVAALGVSIELAQCALTSDHVLEWWDIRDDFYAVAAAFLLIQIANLLSRRQTAIVHAPKIET